MTHDSIIKDMVTYKGPNNKKDESICVGGDKLSIHNSNTADGDITHVPDEEEGEELNNETSTSSQSTRNDNNNKKPQSRPKGLFSLTKNPFPLFHNDGEEVLGTTKWIVFAIVLLSQVLNQGSVNAFYPALPAIQKDMNTTATMTNAIVAIRSLASGFLSAVWATYSDSYGRRNVFTMSNGILLVGNIGSALSINMSMLLSFQMVASIGGAAAYCLSVGIINDIFKDHEKGKALSWNASMNAYSSAITPLIGGIFSQYLGWRSIFWFFVIAYGLLWAAVIILLPETNAYAMQEESKKRIGAGEKKESYKKKIIINPFASLKLLRFPNMLMICVYLGIMGFTNNVMGVSFSWAYSSQVYHFSSTLVGLFYLAGLVGNTAGTWLGGYMSDKLFMRRVTMAKESNQQIFPEMRLSQPGVLVAAISMAGAYVAYGWSIEKHAHFSIGIISQVFVLFGLALGTSFLNVYAVQSFPRHGSSAQACMQTIKCILFSVGRLWAIDLQNLIGSGVLYTIFGGALLITCPFVTYIQLNRRKWLSMREALMDQ